ncbi:MAG: hypothetical protein ACLQUY_10805 [Ktedonobacterales bacterium]
MSTMSKRILAMAVTLAILATAAVGFMQRPKAVSAAALNENNNGTHLCLQSNSTLCLDLLNDNSSGNEETALPSL